MAYEAGAASHLDRMNWANHLCSLLEPMFARHGITATEYGQNVILNGNPGIIARLRKLDVKKSEVVCMTKFSPDFILWHEKSVSFLMMDAKASTTPMFFDAAIRRLALKAKDPSLDRHRIGEIEREAWDNYTKRYPRKKVAICMAAPYHPRLVLAEWASELVEFHRYEGDLNEAAGGSGTPHVNIDLGRMRTLDEFLAKELGIALEKTMYERILADIRTWPLNKPHVVNWRVFNNVIASLHRKCPWVIGRVPRGHRFEATIAGEFGAAGIRLEVF